MRRAMVHSLAQGPRKHSEVLQAVLMQDQPSAEESDRMEKLLRQVGAAGSLVQ